MDSTRNHRSIKTDTVDFEVIGEDRYHWILENETVGMKLEWAKTQAPTSMKQGSHLWLKLETAEKEEHQKMANLRQLLQELIQ
jgi:hypothetical protein